MLREIPTKLAQSRPDETIADSTASPAIATPAFKVRDRRAALKAQAPDYEGVLDSLFLGVCVFDAQQRLLLSNQRWVEMYRLTPAQTRPGVTLREIVEARVAAGTCPTDADSYLALCAGITASDEAKNWTVALSDGRTIRVCNRPTPEGGWAATHEDVSDGATASPLMAAEAPHKRESQILEMIALSAPIEQALNQVVHLVEANVKEAFGAILLVSDDGAHLRVAAAPNLSPAHRAAFDGVPLGSKAASYGAAIGRRAWVSVANMRGDPLWRDHRQWLEEDRFSACWAIPIISRHGAALGALALHARNARALKSFECDLVNRAARIAALAVERKQADDRMHFMANHDPLTGLANRALLNDRLAQAALHARRYDRRFTVAYIDLDNFKSVNDTLGHEAGDQLLKIIADRIVRHVRATDTVARLGGDEFVVVLTDQPKDVDAVPSVLAKLVAAIAQPVSLGGCKRAVTCSVGAANYPDDGADFAALLALADAAMYRAKKAGGDGFPFRPRGDEPRRSDPSAAPSKGVKVGAALSPRRRTRGRNARRGPIDP